MVDHQRKGRGRGKGIQGSGLLQFFSLFFSPFLLFSFFLFFLFPFSFFFSMTESCRIWWGRRYFKEDLEMQFGFVISFSKDRFIAFHPGRIPPAIEHVNWVSWNISFLFLFLFPSHSGSSRGSTLYWKSLIMSWLLLVSW